MTPPLSTAEEDLATRLLQGEKRALSKVLSLIEDETESGRRLLNRLYPHTGRAYRIGITGAPGSGKSTLVDLLTRLIRADGGRVGILAVDPTSPFSGGAILGDRIRMPKVALDSGVFIRSMASRGCLGGLAAATERACEALDAAGYDWVILETVGVGQSEMEVVSVADTTVVVLVPESGDGVQMMKAGLMEAGDVFVVNKYDREGGSRLSKEIRVLLALREERAPEGSWMPRLVSTVAIRDAGGRELLEAIGEHRSFLAADSRRAEELRESRIHTRIRMLLRARVVEEAWSRLELDGKIAERTGEVLRREVSPYHVVESLLSRLWETDGSPGGPGGKGRSG